MTVPIESTPVPVHVPTMLIGAGAGGGLGGGGGAGGGGGPGGGAGTGPSFRASTKLTPVSPEIVTCCVAVS